MDSNEKTFYVMGKNGVILALVNTAEQARNYGRKQTPVFEMDPLDLGQFPFKFELVSEGDHQHNEELRTRVAAFYQKIGKYSPYGDAIQVTRSNMGQVYTYSINFIARRAYHKPGLAADLVLFLQDAVGRTFFVGIKRENAPGKNKPALIGGFMDVEGYHLQTPAETLVSESVQEAGIKVVPDPSERKRFKEEPFADKLSVQVTLGKGKNKVKKEGQLLLVRTVNTSKQERNPSLGLSRVNRTTAYVLKLMFPGMMLNIDYVRDLFTAGDDAKEMCIVDITDAKRRIGFGITHHRRLYNEALRKIDLAYLIKTT